MPTPHDDRPIPHEDRPTPHGDALRRRRLLGAGLVLGPLALAPMGWAAPSSAAEPPIGPSGASTSASAAGKPTAPAVEPRLTVHAIDTYRGATGAGLRCDLSYFENGGYRRLGRFETLAGGRTKDPLLTGDALKSGRYEITLHLAEYFASLGARIPQPPFLEEVPIRFTVADADQHYHVAILFNPWSYSYYRGS
ncbi:MULTISPECIES: hydroxyisourate hydrolase [Streptomyces]|uniref:hydroxyisourate hydrolase n=1 Tax=Streptomyces solicathayae TaxID=3081768 RepID=A0ABZ0M445_9ACTN|nr:hydroxyisourate hydrolase [Streptomyces sp. HUAS YS2]WOX26433.1 hydroxyisourate hydrolase [Streptomyces sp. HUAS YS2]